jgi:hypothetical protein
MRKHPRFATSLAAPCLALGALVPIVLPLKTVTSRAGQLGERSHHPPLRVRARSHRARDVAFGRTVAVRPAPAGGVWQRLRICESEDNYKENSGNGYYGAYQFSLTTWREIGGIGEPDQASQYTQDALAQRLEARTGWLSWPNCAYSLGLV